MYICTYVYMYICIDVYMYIMYICMYVKNVQNNIIYIINRACVSSL